MGFAGAAVDRWVAARNRLLAAPAFQRFAVSFPPFRPIARQRSRQLFDLLAGFAYSQVLYATVKLGLIEMLAERALPLTALSQRTGWPAERLERLLKAAASLQVLGRTSTGDYTLGIHGAALAGNPWIARFITHHHLLYEDLADPLALLSGEKKDNKLKDFWNYSSTPHAAEYTALMAGAGADPTPDRSRGRSRPRQARRQRRHPWRLVPDRRAPQGSGCRHPHPHRA